MGLDRGAPWKKSWQCRTRAHQFRPMRSCGLFDVSPRVDEAEQRRLAEEEAARTSRVFFQTVPGAASTSTIPGSMAMPTLSGFDLNGQRAQPTAQNKQLAFLNATVDRRATSLDRVMPPASPFVLQAGARLRRR